METDAHRHSAERNIPVWDDEPWAGAPVLEGEHAADACVVGLGGSGLACIGELLARGCKVVGIDAGSVAGGAAGRNGGFLLAGVSKFHHEVVAQFGHKRAAVLHALTSREITRMSRQTPDAIRRCGSLRIAADEAELRDCDAQLAAMRADGLEVEPYSGPEGEGLLFPKDGVLQPLHRCRIVARGMVWGGAQLFENSPVVAIDERGVSTPHGRVNAPRVLVCVDGRLDLLLPELATRVRTARLQMLATEPDPSVSFPRPVYFRHGFEYWRQLENGGIAIGGFRDKALDEEWTHSTEPTPRVQGMIEEFLRDRLGVKAAVTHRWAASVGYTADGLPFAGPVRDNVWAAGGYNGTGNVVGSISGRGIAQLAVDGRSPLLEAFASG
jgi:gamma-glutamylputrescine oxidase